MSAILMAARAEDAPPVAERLAALTERLVAFPTVAHNGPALRDCVAWVCEHVEARVPRIHTQRFMSGGKPAILFTCGGGPPRVLLSGHLDVVTANPKDFHLRQHGGWLNGRGVADMKGPVAALLDLLETERRPGLGLLLTTDEESGGTDGVAYALRRLDWRPEVVLLPDGGANMRLVTEQKGLLRLRLRAEGRAAHAARPWLAINALDRLYRGHRAIQRAYPRPRGEEDWRVSVALTALHNGDNAPNTVPDRAEALLDLRYPASGPHAAEPENLFRAMQRLAARACVTAESLLHADAFLLDTTSPWVALLQATAQEVRRAPLPLAREAGASDARYFAAAGVPTLIFQPECAGWHGAKERLNLESLAVFREICATFVRSALV